METPKKAQILQAYGPNDAIGIYHVVATLAIVTLCPLLNTLYGTPLTLLFTTLLQSFALVKVFVIFHDMGHGSYFQDKNWNVVGQWILSFVTVTPTFWSSHHRLHHANSGNLDASYRWNDTIFHTTAQFKAMPAWKQKAYRLIRDPKVFFIISPFFVWFVKYRGFYGGYFRVDTMFNNFFSGVILALIWHYCGSVALVSHVISMLTAGGLGILLFHCQHGFNPAFVRRKDTWGFHDSAFVGSSVLSIPYPLKWFTMGIEYHHIHHFETKIPGYKLQAIYENEKVFPDKSIMGYAQMYESLQYVLFDEKSGKFVTFAEVQ